MLSKKNNYILSWLESQQSWGNLSFSLAQVLQEFPEVSEAAITLALNRLSKKEKIVSIYKGFYLIIPPEYSAKGILPPEQFIDDLMNYLDKPYYVGLLSAASLYGAAHQQPQEFFVLTDSKQLNTNKKGIKINYLIKTKISSGLVMKRNTITGQVNVSSPELTAADLVYYHNKIGGINRICSVISELGEQMSPERISNELIRTLSVPTIQRLGLILDKVLDYPELAQKLWNLIKQNEIKLFMQPLRAGGLRSGFHRDNKWKIIINTKIELEE